MAATLEKIYEVALHHYHMKLVAGTRLSLKPSSNLVIQKSSIDVELTTLSCAKVSTNV